jgi:hypothetical protein
MNPKSIRKERNPIGITPRYIHDELRCVSLVEAMMRYAHAGLRIPKDWIEELEHLNSRKEAV